MKKEEKKPKNEVSLDKVKKIPKKKKLKKILFMELLILNLLLITQ